MSPEEVLEALDRLAREVGLEVRRVPAAADAEASSGVCRLRGRVWVLLSPADPPRRRVAVLAAALREHAGPALESRYLPPAVRAQLDGAEPSTAGATPLRDPGGAGAT